MTENNPLSFLSPGHSMSFDDPIETIKDWVKSAQGRFKIIKSTRDKYTVVRVETHKNSIRGAVFSACKDLKPFEVRKMSYKTSYVRILISEYNAREGTHIRVLERSGSVYVFAYVDPTKVLDETDIREGIEKFIEFQREM